MIARITSTLAMLLLIFAGSRALIRALPGDPAETLAAESGTPLSLQAIREDLGLNQPFFRSLMTDMGHFAHGDWGTSLLSRKAVAPVVRERFGRTLQLTGLALFLGLTASLTLGLMAASRPGGRADAFCDAFGAVTAALPTPWIGPVLLVLFAVKIPVFPAGGHPALPATTLALGFCGLWARLIRERVAETLADGAAPGARARGVPELKVVIKYGLAPCAGALLAYLGTQAGSLLAGAFVTEALFDWRGMGSLLVDAVLKRDYPVIEASVFVAASTSFAGTALGDWMQFAVDPRRGTGK